MQAKSDTPNIKMRIALTFCACFALLCLGITALFLPVALDSAIKRESENLSATIIVGEAWAIMQARSEAALWRRMTQAELRGLRSDLRAQLTPISEASVRAIAEHERLAADARKAVAASEVAIRDADVLIRDVRPQVIGLAAGWKMAGGFSAQAIRTVTPSLQTTAANTAAISTDWKAVSPTLAQNTDKAVSNVEKMTRPVGWVAKILKAIANFLF